VERTQRTDEKFDVCVAIPDKSRRRPTAAESMKLRMEHLVPCHANAVSQYLSVLQRAFWRQVKLQQS